MTYIAIAIRVRYNFQVRLVNGLRGIPRHSQNGMIIYTTIDCMSFFRFGDSHRKSII